MRHVVELRFGLTGEKPRTLEEVGAELGVTRERVRQLESRALREIQAAAPGAEALPARRVVRKIALSVGAVPPRRDVRVGLLGVARLLC